MHLEVLIKTIKVGNTLRIKIPKEVTTYLDLKPRDTLVLTVSDHEMVIKKAIPCGLCS